VSKKKNVLYGAYILIATLLDFTTTLYFTTFSHIEESNPFVKVLLSHNPIYFFGFKLLTLGFIFGVFYKTQNNKQLAFKLTAYSCGTIWMLAGLWNTYVFYF